LEFAPRPEQIVPTHLRFVLVLRKNGVCLFHVLIDPHRRFRQKLREMERIALREIDTLFNGVDFQLSRFVKKLHL
jgi:hypothetical protein